ncbi:hypothetical protein [Chryseobacterium sp. SL1]|uniref:hypothetical protein n=1 Tax=Chryseobacterium sp. SL1 TaxID=2995159 RepID=UPI00227270A3|nr:hypothetical protein [Chryseobacterium sp. SL1]MCY1662745.1 hypothetical protein [Chryseobacterium sp. SL1]
MSFKLIAIRPLDGCNSDFLKNLKENRIYQFCNDYDFKFENEKDKSKITSIKYTSTILEQLYCLNNLNIRISAIAGKNGSGKSSLVELLYAGFYNLAIDKNIIEDEENNIDLDEINTRLFGFNHSHKLSDSIEFLTKNNIKSKIVFFEKIKKDFEKYLSFLDTPKIIRERIENINLEIYFSLKDVEDGKDDIYILKIADTTKIYKTIRQTDNTYKIGKESKDYYDKLKKSKNLFYNIIVNYSLYGLNTKEMGVWLETLFHKNDGYQTPIVLNPMRTEGNFDINIETFLSKSRLFTNLMLNNSLIQISQNNIIEKIKFSIEEKSNPYKNYQITYKGKKETKIFHFKNNILTQIFNYNPEHLSISETPFNNLLIDYIIGKLVKISNLYNIYDFEIKFDIYDYEIFWNEDIDLVLKKLYYEDNSHITIKLKQCINFLFFNNIQNKDLLNDNLYFHFNNENSLIFTDYLKNIKHIYRNKIEISNNYLKKDLINKEIFFLPPAIFNVDYIFHNKSKFSELSSGEKQKVYSINSILYHIINLNSVHNNSSEYKYNNLNIILDEIELYFHPELQRTFISDLLSSLKKIKLENVQNLNFIFITHSPFILSDIPKQNILFLSLDENKRAIAKKEIKQTFASNIHEMLTNGFFMEYTKGEFILNKIKKFLKFYSIFERYRNNRQALQHLIPVYNKNKQYWYEMIQLIGEDYLKTTLNNHIDDIESNLIFSREFEIIRLERKLQQLRNERNE